MVGGGTGLTVNTGNVGIGTTSPAYILDILSKSSVSSASFTGTGLNDMTSGGAFTGATAKNYKVQIDGTGSPDTWKWSDDGGSTWYDTEEAITGSAQTFYSDNQGVAVTFGATTGHTLGDYWTFSTTVTNPLAIRNPAGTKSFYVGNDAFVGIGTTTNPFGANGGGIDYAYLPSLGVNTDGLTMGTFITHTTFSIIGGRFDSSFTLNQTYLGDSFGGTGQMTMFGTAGISISTYLTARNTVGILGIAKSDYSAFGGQFVGEGTSTNRAIGVLSKAISYTGGAGYGVYIQPGSGGGTNYGLYQDGASDKNYFAGNVGIGTTSPTSALVVKTPGASNSQLSVLTSSWGTTLYVADGTDAGSLYLRHGTGQVTVNQGTANGALTIWNDTELNVFLHSNWYSFIAGSNSRLGIGTSAPIAKLHVHGDYNNGGTGGILLDADDNSTPDRYSLRINPYVLGGGMVGYIFQTKSVTGGTNTPLVFDHAGNVGIGTTAPGAKLHINGGVGSLATGIAFGDGDSGIFELTDDQFYVQISGTPSWVMDSSHFGGNPGSALPLMQMGGVQILPYAADTDTGVQYLNPNQVSLVGGGTGLTVNTGNVGIGTTGPTAKLDVLGDIKVSNSATSNLRITTDGSYAYYVLNNITSHAFQASGASRATISTNGVWSRPGFSVGENYGSVVPPTNGAIIEGNVGIGTTNPVAKLEVKGTTTGGSIAKFTDVNTTGCSIDTAGIISCSSDGRLKKNIEQIEYGLDALMALRPVEYNWRFENDQTAKSLGFIAQEVERIAPKLVKTDESGFKQLNTIGLVPVLARAIQEQQGEITQLETHNTQLDLNISQAAQSTSDLQAAVNEKLNVISQKLALGEESSRILGARIDADEQEISNIKTKLAAAETKLLDAELNLATFEAATNDVISTMLETENMLTERVLSHEERLKALEDKLAAATVSVDEGVITLPAVSASYIAIDADGNAALSGIFKAEEVQADGVVSGSYAVKNEKDTDAPTVGTTILFPPLVDENKDGINDITGNPMPPDADGDGVNDVTGKEIVPSDGKNVEVKTKAVTENSKIFVTPDQPAKIGVTKTAAGVGFTISIDEPVADGLNISWFIVEEK
ncbi:MAG: hypothetical protein A2359_02635 [Candidatus Moranbacteria bacterium RIFOXYB1_FULL_43_19]|nr:MAG: hypothetical protein A2359_02635 [Candidatus Moranbacteria bacterium RIFOXYB1_FULL_43_19]